MMMVDDVVALLRPQHDRYHVMADAHSTANEIGRQLRQAIKSAFRPAIFNRYVLALDVTGVCKAPPKRGYKGGPLGSGGGVNEPDHRHRGLLRARRERPRGRAPEQRDERAAPHSITSSARANARAV